MGKVVSETLITTDVDYRRNGKQVGWLLLPHSVTRSAYGNIAIPVAVIRNGRGPTAFFMAGNHGDEYEGQIALVKLIRALEPDQIRGRVIVLPAANLPAAMAGTRVSPIDGGNLNRAFPGHPRGTVTEQIAYYIDSVLFPLADVFHDLHSGGGSLDYLPFVSAHSGVHAGIDAKARALLASFGMPLALTWAVKPDARYSPIAAMKRGVVALGGEFGGAGRVDAGIVKRIEQGLMNTLVHMGIVARPARWKPPPPPRMVRVPSREFYVHAPDPGLFEPATELGEMVRRGQLCGHVHFVDDPARAPAPCHFAADGLVVCKRHPGRVERGDCVAHLAIDG